MQAQAACDCAGNRALSTGKYVAFINTDALESRGMIIISSGSCEKPTARTVLPLRHFVFFQLIFGIKKKELFWGDCQLTVEARLLGCAL